ncbi:MAG: membrane integrity-associated transporter subunit PqiC [Paludibacterium sp.]|uniref:PqiC family protein n=1 Tax=Paludibacterium sp. TaxID=1917523 RepID=UPI0025D291B2|nr:PqiC family protein [Paludibacterium sp.]MBV8047946.1 membrane integrity-associated transporter subunit PqiC [Paludibacterium sp.]MBV8647223.1 membrane integrity-associated transporter subunit PqiC [Paludibacterium sp.]
MTFVRVLLCCLLLSACASAPVDYYRLQTHGDVAGGHPAAGPVLQVGPVSLPPWLDRPELVRTDASGRVVLLARAEWAAPLPQLIAAALAQGIGADLRWGQARAWPSTMPYAADWLVTLDVRDLTAGADSLRLDASWRVLRDGRVLASGSLTREEPLHGGDAAALVAAHDQALTDLAAAMAASLNTISP